MKPLTLHVSLSAILAMSAFAGDWPFFTGPDYDNASKETKWKPYWGAGSNRSEFTGITSLPSPNIIWKAKVGTGAASFVVKGNRVVTSGAGRREETIFCFDLDTGKELWKFDFKCKFEKRMFDGGTAATPTIDGERVFNLSYDGQLHCLALADGKLLWKKHLIEDFGGKLSRWKYASSPLVQGELLILDNGGSGSSTLALDKKTGVKVWGQGKEGAGYATPTPVMQGGKPAVVMFKGKKLVAHDLKSGKRLWEVDWETNYDVNASSPIPLPNNRLLVSSGYDKGRAVLYDISGRKPKQLWRNDEIKTKMSSCVVHDGHLFAVCGDSDGQLICVSMKDGKTQWRQKGFGFGTLALVGDKLIVLAESGNLVIAKADGREYRLIIEEQVLGRKCWVKPVFAHGRLLIKNNKGLVNCIDMR